MGTGRGWAELCICKQSCLPISCFVLCLFLFSVAPILSSSSSAPSVSFGNSGLAKVSLLGWEVLMGPCSKAAGKLLQCRAWPAFCCSISQSHLPPAPSVHRVAVLLLLHFTNWPASPFQPAPHTLPQAPPHAHTLKCDHLSLLRCIQTATATCTTSTPTP